MLLGIDVGGTFTDGVVFEKGRIAAAIKHPTDEKQLKASIWSVLDALLLETDRKAIDRVVLSTTLITNLLMTGKGERTALILVPGYGLPQDAYNICPDCFFVNGFMDFKGREIEKLKQKEVLSVLQEIRARGIKRAAVAGKFASRNHIQEQQIKMWAQEDFPELDVYISSETVSRLNFPRRAVTTYYTAMIKPEWNAFADEIETAFKERGLAAEIAILKADGGTMSLAGSRSRPCETIFSGPAASTMGALALAQESLNSVVLDIGGTTTDISLLVGGKPLYASKGAKIAGQLTHVNAFAVRSLPLGGDSLLQPSAQVEEIIQTYRLGPAICFGGTAPTVIDAFNTGQDLKIGNYEASREAMDKLAGSTGSICSQLCQDIISQVMEKLQSAIKDMFKEWEQEPAYKVWEVINRRKFELHRIIGIGAASESMVPHLAQAMGVDHFCHNYGPVANGLGAALVRPTLEIEVHIDTQTKTYSVSPVGEYGALQVSGRYQLEQAKDFTRTCMENIANENQMIDLLPYAQFCMEEQFNVVRGWDTAGKIFDIGMEIAPGFVDEFQGVLL